MPKYEDTETSLPRRAHHSMPRQSMPTSKPNDMKQILILILCAFVLSCKSTKTVSSSNESERNAVSQAQWRSAQNLSFSSLQRLTALSFDSCVVVFGGADTFATPLYSSFSYPSGDPSASFKAKPSTSHGNATDFVRGVAVLSITPHTRQTVSISSRSVYSLRPRSTADAQNLRTTPFP